MERAASRILSLAEPAASRSTPELRETHPCLMSTFSTLIATAASSPGVVAIHSSHLAAVIVITTLTDSLDVEPLIAERAAKGDAACEAALNVYARRLAKSLATVVNVVDPDVIVFGGGVSNIAPVLEKARAELDAWVFSDCCATEFKTNRWGDSSGVRGAARLPPLRAA